MTAPLLEKFASFGRTFDVSGLSKKNVPSPYRMGRPEEGGSYGDPQAGR